MIVNFSPLHLRAVEIWGNLENIARERQKLIRFNERRAEPGNFHKFCKSVTIRKVHKNDDSFSHCRMSEAYENL